MSKRDHESDAEYKARKKAKKEKKKAKRRKKEERESAETGSTDNAVSPSPSDVGPAEPIGIGKAFTSFAEAPFAPPVQRALREAGFTAPSPIQARAWPIALAGKDLIAVAKTGSGKTLGFFLPVFHRLAVDARREGALPAPQCLVLSPTRELAIQLHGECVKFGACVHIRAECVYGGTNVAAQIKQLRAADPHVVIATPGRLCDILERGGILSLSSCVHCVLDEADRMLDMGFEKQLNQVMEALPAERQTLFFTATWPKSVRRVAANFLREGATEEIFVGDGVGGELEANKAVTQTFVEAQDDEKDKKLYDILCALGEAARIVIFANTKRRVDFVADRFWQEGFATCAVHGDKAQHERDKSLQQFIKGDRSILVATDVAARGLDIKGVTHVVNFDMARDVESYVHRIGRTGRAGEVGEAITFWNPDYDKECSPALVTIAKNAGQVVPPFLQKYEKAKGNKQWKVAAAEKVVL